MSPASQSKPKDNKASKEAQKASAKPAVSGNTVAGIPASAYNPLLGTFHNLEVSASSTTPPIHSDRRFRDIDETDEHPAGSVVAGIEYDSVSNNDSCSGESEDHKEKTCNTPVRLDSVPGTDNDKREKIRQKNERKHQRQKERRAQELHERCNGFLMSRKLEALAQQLVAMGFPHERATMALILNEGRVEQSVAWLFEAGEEDSHKDKNIGSSNLKIDISEELARVADMEIRYGCSKQEVEKVIVACEGDLDKAAESLRQIKQGPPLAPPKPEEIGDPLTINNAKQSGVVSQRPLTKPAPSPNQHKNDEKEFNYAKEAVTIGLSSEPNNRNIQPLNRTQPKFEWVKPQQATIPSDKRGSNAGSNLPVSLAPPLQVSPQPSKIEARHYMAAGGDYKNLQPRASREPVVVMQRPQTVNAKQVPATSMSSSPPGVAANWYPANNVEAMRSNAFVSHTPVLGNLGQNYPSSNQIYHQLQYQPQQFVSHSSYSVDPQTTSRAKIMWNRNGASPTLAAAASLGLFSGLGSAATSGASSPVDWSTGGSMHFDYTNIDWSVGRSISPPRSKASWPGVAPLSKSTAQFYGSNASGVVAQPPFRSVPSNGGMGPMSGLQDGGVPSAETAPVGSREWRSPFEGKDLFSLPRQFVYSPSL
ncbi:unnamed protein product [Lupinus luteus]|uniref:UBA domain-containing protein n=1 Tax=Lupinus luteus TaxID=3873 RepID=A0AAV1X376_LUPLU